MKNYLLLFIAVAIFHPLHGQPSRKEVAIPDILGYKSLKCELHIHTVYSDGYIWPTYRIQEAWEDGLDAIALTDHIEYRPYLKDDLNKPYEVALPKAEELGILLIRGVEITKGMPPGHLNALFIEDANTIEDKDPLTSIQKAAKQGAFITWNHPGWKAQQFDTVRWWDIHTEIYNAKQLHGIEVVGYHGEYFPEALGWANEKQLTMIGATDIHEPIRNEFSYPSQHRTMTIAFAKDRTVESLKEALFAGRTVIFTHDNMLIGRAEYLDPIFQQSISIKPAKIRNKKYVYLMVYNSSDVPYEFTVEKHSDIRCIDNIILKPHQTTLVQVRGMTESVDSRKNVEIPIVIKNLWTADKTPLKTMLKVQNNLND